MEIKTTTKKNRTFEVQFSVDVYLILSYAVGCSAHGTVTHFYISVP